MSLSLRPSTDQGSGHPSFFTRSSSNGDMINAVFGVFAVLASAITIWQGHKTWKVWREHHPRHAQAIVPLDLELGGPPPPYTSPELPVNRPLPNDVDLPPVGAHTEGERTVPSVLRDSEAAPVTLATSAIPVQQEVPSADMQLGRSWPSPSASASLEPLDAPPLPMDLDTHTEGIPHSG